MELFGLFRMLTFGIQAAEIKVFIVSVNRFGNVAICLVNELASPGQVVMIRLMEFATALIFGRLYS